MEESVMFDDLNGCPRVEMKTRLLNGFNNGRDPSDGVGGRPAYDENTPQPIIDHSKDIKLVSDSAPLMSLSELTKRLLVLEKRVYELEHPYKPGMHP